ncbi:MAG: MarR family transcriptional regulator [Streptosporangiales bacterium]|nr:MarR family transcriptional regulator [Streptosporangiales bacterium]
MTAAADLLPAATRLRTAVARVHRRLRRESAGSLTATQTSVLARLDREGPATLTELAADEGVRPQSIAVSLDRLEQQGLIARRRADHDRRRVTISITERGRETIVSERRSRDLWLAGALGAELDAEQRDLLLHACELLDRLAER